MKIVGHQNILKFLKSVLERNKLSHAYLFYGPESVGKRTVALEFIANILKKNINEDQLNLIKDQLVRRVYPDFYVVSRLKNNRNITIEQIRNLKEKLSLSSLSESYRIALVDDASEMSIAAANSFLKLLEEPPNKVIIILLTKNKDSLPKTIISRCQLVKFDIVSLKEIKEFLLVNFDLNEKNAEEIANLSFGRPGLAIKFVQNLEFLENFKREIENFLELFTADLLKKFDFAQESYQSPNFLAWIVALRDLLLVKQGIEPRNKFCLNRLRELAKKISFNQICKLYFEIERVRYYFDKSVNKKLIIENLFINL